MKKVCQIHRYCYEGNECPLCMQERAQKMALRWVENNMGIPKKIFENDSKQESMDEMLEKLKEKFNKH